MLCSAVFSVFTALLIWQLKRVFSSHDTEKKERNKRSTAIENGLCALLRDTLISKCEGYCERGSISTNGLRNIALMYDAYHNLGGNDVVTALYEQMKELPIK